MITVTAYLLVWCYTTTFAWCQTVPSLPDAQSCTEIVAKIKVKYKDARADQCLPYRVLVVSQTGTLPVPKP